MTEYNVTWSIPLDAESPEDAAAQALAIQRDPGSLATVFRVTSPDGVYMLLDVEDPDNVVTIPDDADPRSEEDQMRDKAIAELHAMGDYSDVQ